MKMKKFNTEMHFIVLSILLFSAVSLANPSFLADSFASLVNLPDQEKPVVENSTTQPTGQTVQTNIHIIDARLDAATKTVSVTLKISGAVPVLPFIVRVDTGEVVVQPNQLSLDYPIIIAVPLEIAYPSMNVVVDEENFIEETNESDNYLLVLQEKK